MSAPVLRSMFIITSVLCSPLSRKSEVEIRKERFHCMIQPKPKILYLSCCSSTYLLLTIKKLTGYISSVPSFFIGSFLYHLTNFLLPELLPHSFLQMKISVRSITALVFRLQESKISRLYCSPVMQVK